MPGKAAHHKLGDDPAGIKPTCRASERDPTSVGAAAAAAGVDEVAAAKARAAEAIAKQAAKRTAEADKEKAAAAAAAYRQFQAQAQAGVGPTSSYGAAPNSAAAAAAAAVGAVPAETFVAADEEGAAREDMRRKVLVRPRVCAVGVASGVCSAKVLLASPADDLAISAAVWGSAASWVYAWLCSTPSLQGLF